MFTHASALQEMLAAAAGVTTSQVAHFMVTLPAQLALL